MPFPKGRLNITKTWKKKTATFTRRSFPFFFFFFFFFSKIVSHDESSARKNKNANLSGNVILAKSDPSNHCCRIKKSFLGLQYVQELWLLWHIRFTTFKNQPWELASSSELVSGSLSNQGRTENSSSKSLWAWNHSSSADYLNSTEKHVQICED